MASGRAGLSCWGWNEGEALLSRKCLKETLEDVPVGLAPETTLPRAGSMPLAVADSVSPPG